MMLFCIIGTLIAMVWGVKLVWDTCEEVITDPDPVTDAQVVYIIILVVLVSFMEVGLSGLLVMFWSFW